MAGFGIQPAGLTPFGVGAPPEAPAPGATALTAPDLVAARGFDLQARDYAVRNDLEGAPHEAMDPLAQQVLLRLTTRRGSLAFAPTYGNEWLNVKKNPGDLPSFGRRCVDDALRDLVVPGQVRVVSVQAKQSGGLAVLAVVWRDLRTGRERTDEIARTSR